MKSMTNKHLATKQYIKFLHQFIKDLKATIKRQQTILQRHQVAMSHINVHNEMVRRIMEQTVTEDREALPALMPMTPSSETD